MGWSGHYNFGSVKDYMNQMNFENDTVKSTLLDYAVVHRVTAYGAVRTTNKVTGVTYVWAMIVLFQFGKNETMTKDLDESCGPCECHCPERILKLLTPATGEYALKWRESCWKNIKQREWKLVEGMELIDPDTKATCIVGDAIKNRKGQYMGYITWGNGGTAQGRINKNWLNNHNFVPYTVALAQAI